MRIVLDTNVLVRAHARTAGPAREVVKRIAGGSHVLVTSAFILDEIERVLHYPRLQAQWRLTNEEIEAFVDELDRMSEVVNVAGEPAEPLSPDPDDDPIIQTARLGQAAILCTRDRHLCRSRKVRDYCAQHGIRIMTDEELLSVLREA